MINWGHISDPKTTLKLVWPTYQRGNVGNFTSLASNIAARNSSHVTAWPSCLLKYKSIPWYPSTNQKLVTSEGMQTQKWRKYRGFDENIQDQDMVLLQKNTYIANKYSAMKWLSFCSIQLDRNQGHQIQHVLGSKTRRNTFLKPDFPSNVWYIRTTSAPCIHHNLVNGST